MKREGSWHRGGPSRLGQFMVSPRFGDAHAEERGCAAGDGEERGVIMGCFSYSISAAARQEREMIRGRVWQTSLATVLGFVLSGAQGAAQAANVVQQLDRGWQFRQVTEKAASNGWMPATVPGDVHLDLLANKKIDDPFYRTNESKLQWIEN